MLECHGIQLELLWSQGKAKGRFLSTEEGPLLSVTEIRDVGYAVIDHLVAAPGVDEQDLERCDVCHEFGNDFIPFEDATGHRKLICGGCGHLAHRAVQERKFERRGGPQG